MSPLRLGCHLRTSIDDRWVQSTPPSVIVEKKKKKKKVDRSWIHILETDSIVFFVKMIHCDRLIVCGWHWQKRVCVSYYRLIVCGQHCNRTFMTFVTLKVWCWARLLQIKKLVVRRFSTEIFFFTTELLHLRVYCPWKR